MRISIALGAAALALAAFAEPALAGGFENRYFDAKGVGMANAFTAIADTPAANAQNPAGLSQLDGVQVEASLAYAQGFIKFEADDPVEGKENNRSRALFWPTLFASVEMNDYLHLGFGMYVPWSTNVLWSDDWPGRYIAIHTVVQAFEFNPNLSVKIPLEEGNSIAIAAGASLVESNMQLKQAIDFSSLGAADGYVKMHGDNKDFDYAYDFGVLFSQNDGKLRIGATYRSEVDDIHVHGRAAFSNIPTNPLTGQAALPAGSKARARLTYPDRIRAGIAMQVDEPLTVALEFTWTNWSKLRHVFVRLTDIGRSTALDLRWRDSYFVSLGASYVAVPDRVAIRGGLYYDQSPTRRETTNPSIPDTNRLGFSLGAGFSVTEMLSIDVAYFAVFLRDLEKNNLIGADKVAGGNPRANGKYETYGHIGMLTFGLKF